MKFRFSNISVFLVVLTCFIIDWSFKNWEKQDRVIEHDVHWYYAYLPSIFIYHDIKQEKSDYRFGENYYLFWPIFTSDGKKVNKTTMGLSVLYAPFFFVAHGYALISGHLPGNTGYPAHGFSEPYKIFLLLSSIFYLIIGLDFLKKTLSHFSFSDGTIAIVILLLGLGTNLLCYSSQSAPNAHVYNFFLFSAFIYYTVKWHLNPTIKRTLILGLTLGFISLIRPSNTIIIVFFILFGIKKISDIKEKIFLLKKEYLSLVAMAVLSFIIWIPQFIYWKKVTGSFLYYSYAQEGFFFGSPRIFDGLFSFRKGWLLYTPMMGFALAGIFLLKNELKKFKSGIIIFLLLNIYIVFSWWCWWYGGTFGQRSMVESYALLSIPFAAFIQWISEKHFIYKGLFFTAAIFLIWLNIFQTYQFEFHLLHWDGTTRDLYVKQFGKLSKINDFDKYVDPPDYIFTKQSSKEINRRQVYLKAYNGKYVCADASIKNQVVANRDYPFEWETFLLVEYKNKECSFLAFNNHFLCPELGNETEITATRTNIDKWEVFSLEQAGENKIALKAYNGKYISVDEKSMFLFARGEDKGEQEIFEVIPVK